MEKKIIVIAVLIFFTFIKCVQAEELDSLIKSQEDSIGITDFIQESNRYTEDIFSKTDAQNVFSDALAGKVDNKTIIKCILQLFGKEIKNTITIFAKV